MSSTPCSFDDASLVMDELAMVVVEDEDKESVEGVGKIQQNCDSMMCNTPSVLDDVYHPATVPVMIETTESKSIVVVEEEDRGEDEEEKERRKVTETVSCNDGQNPEEDEKEDESLEGAGKLILVLFHSANTKVDAALEAFSLDLNNEDKKECNRFVRAGGCLALVLLMKNCLDKAIDRIPVCDQVTQLNELAELTTLHKTLHIMMQLSCQHFESRVGIAMVDGVESVIKVMETFPKCYKLQEFACVTLLNLTGCSIGKANAIESGPIEVLLAAVNLFLASASHCEIVCRVLYTIVIDSKGNTELLISLGGATAVAKVRRKWPDNNDVQAHVRVRQLAHLIALELKARPDGVRKLIQDLFHSDSAKVYAALDALEINLDEAENKCEDLVTAGGCFALVCLMQNCLDKAIDRIPACDQVTELNELVELTTLNKTLDVIIDLTFQHDESEVAIAKIGGAEVVVKVMKTFPKCQALQDKACRALINLACCSVGIANAIESGGIQVILAAINNHLVSADVCQRACWALHNIVNGSNENTGLLITLGGATAVAKVRNKWPNNDNVQTQVRCLNTLIVAEMKTWSL
jgi:hypothetical protein